MKPVLVIAGPTASGKSALADELASRMGTEVLSADAMQVYRGMDIGTAKTPVEERRVPLGLIDIADPGDAYSAALFQADCRREIERLTGEGRCPILCGGTGLYIRAAIDDMVFPSGELDDQRRSAYQELASQLGAEGIYNLLKRRDSRAAACIHPHNTRRVVRALELHDEGLSYADQMEGYARIEGYYPSIQFALTMDRERLYARINARVDAMVASGLVKEVESLIERGFRDALTSMQAIGYKEVISAFDGEYTLDEAIDLVKRRTRRYAKRQLAWFRRDKRITWIDMDAHSISSAADYVQSVYMETDREE